ncbi:MAG: sigma-70 family RNA polymerase sigma factor [Acidobacteria bacterium]|nr:sigma-70 family RNA polymerase sigma factor [Acidobacteriota bacterium]MBI3422044.1 sigma-70 family RNA polymerase sigma factor [Acidobacteriota bacterium]
MLTSAIRYQAMNITPQAWQGMLADLMDGIARREQAALSAFYEQTHRQVFGLLLTLLPERATAETVLAEVYKQVWQQTGQAEPAPLSQRTCPLTWLLLLARKLGLERLRALPRPTAMPTPLSVNPPANPSAESGQTAACSENSVVAERRQRVRQALLHLPVEQRRALELACFAGLTYTEIASQLGRAPAEIKSQLAAGMRTLKAHLQP